MFFCVVVVLFNLILFVWFDGYIVLMSVLDELNFWGRIICDGVDFLSWFLFGGLWWSRSLLVWWSVLFGFVSLIVLVVFVLFVVVCIV